MLSRQSVFPLLALCGIVSASALPAVQAIEKRQQCLGIQAGDLKVTPASTPFVICDETPGNVSFIFQPDGNFVAYNAYHDAIWFSGTGGHTCSGNNCTLAFQADGNLVIYYNRVPIWYTETGAGAGVWLWFQNTSPYLYIINHSGGLGWASGEGSVVL